MTRLKFFKNSNNQYIGFECIGHSGYSQSGSDIVCAAVSTAVQMCANYLIKFHSDNVKVTVDNKNAKIALQCNQPFTEADRQISVLVDFANDVREQYSDYFTFEFFGGVLND